MTRLSCRVLCSLLTQVQFMYHRVIPLHCADFPENLAYEVGEDFGREYKTWIQGGGRDRGAQARVGFQLKRDSTHLFFRLVSGWTCGTVTWATQLIAEI